jgi:hypothetical protein
MTATTQPQPILINGRAHASLSAGLSAADCERHQRAFAADGFVVLHGVVPADKLARLHARILEELARAQASGTLFTGGGRRAGHLNCFPGEESRFVYEALEQHGVIDLVRAIFPKAVGAPHVGCNLNLPGSVTQHWHMDRPFTREFMIVNVAAVDTNLRNGATDVLPGTHKRFYPFWRFALERWNRDTTRVELKRGDVLIRTSSLWHRGMPNLTDEPRPMLAYTWEDGGITGGEDPFKVEGGKITFRPNWYHLNWIGELRERAYLAAPITYDAYRFVRSLYGTKGYDH